MREDGVRPILDRRGSPMDVPLTKGRRTNMFDAERRGAIVRHMYFRLGRLEREIASELGISCSTVNYYKNRQKR